MPNTTREVRLEKAKAELEAIKLGNTQRKLKEKIEKLEKEIEQAKAEAARSAALSKPLNSTEKALIQDALTYAKEGARRGYRELLVKGGRSEAEAEMLIPKAPPPGPPAPPTA